MSWSTEVVSVTCPECGAWWSTRALKPTRDPLAAGRRHVASTGHAVNATRAQSRQLAPEPMPGQLDLDIQPPDRLI